VIDPPLAPIAGHPGLLHTPAMRPLLLFVALVGLGCGGDAKTGEPCGSHEDCARGRCVAGVAGPDPVCTPTCAGNEDCPEGWSCSVATENDVLVCRTGTATPFGY